MTSTVRFQQLLRIQCNIGAPLRSLLGDDEEFESSEGSETLASDTIGIPTAVHSNDIETILTSSNVS